MGKKIGWNEILVRLQEIHGDKLDFSKFIYKDAHTKSVVICPKHGEFLASTCNLLYHKQGCRLCHIESTTKTTEQFIQRARSVHGDKYDYSKAVYISNKTNLIITCPLHGDFTQQPLNHVHGMGCPICGRLQANAKMSDTLETFINKAKLRHGNEKYDYSAVNMSDEYVTIYCNTCGQYFKQKRNRHIAGDGCPFCKKYKLEEDMKRILQELNVEYEYQYKPSFLKNGKGQKSLDFYLPQYNIGIECQGIQHFQEVEHFSDKLDYTQKSDEVKALICRTHGLPIIYIYSKSRIKKDGVIQALHIYNDNNIISIEDIIKNNNVLLEHLC